MTTLVTKLRIEDWDEPTIEELDGGRKITRAYVRLRDGADGIESGSASMVCYYRSDGTSDYVVMMHLSGTLEGHEGAFALRGDGGYDGRSAVMRMTVVQGSGTGGLVGISGDCTSESTHADYPFMPLALSYEIV